MLFHVTSQHSWETCWGTLEAKGEKSPPRSERQKWMEGNDKVKVVGAYGHQTAHRWYAIVESTEYSDVQALFREAGHMRMGELEILPITDGIALRKSFGEWEQ